MSDEDIEKSLSNCDCQINEKYICPRRQSFLSPTLLFELFKLLMFHTTHQIEGVEYFSLPE